ncbi:MAG: hypothetical protein LBN42_02205 [Oscillospiraceae bacterium]|nr:hypothetical protein [Oscillospiraceae bacterium]
MNNTTVNEAVDNDKPIDVIAEVFSREEGVLFTYPLPEVIIAIDKITHNELNPYMTPEYANVHWKEIYKDLMAKRAARAANSATPTPTAVATNSPS